MQNNWRPRTTCNYKPVGARVPERSGVEYGQQSEPPYHNAQRYFKMPEARKSGGDRKYLQIIFTNSQEKLCQRSNTVRFKCSSSPFGQCDPRVLVILITCSFFTVKLVPILYIIHNTQTFNIPILSHAHTTDTYYSNYMLPYRERVFMFYTYVRVRYTYYIVYSHNNLITLGFTRKWCK